jgi:cellulose synthase/poly-beta-1,6-N-acetylglucosamine synthase-like glycosyltransferase
MTFTDIIILFLELVIFIYGVFVLSSYVIIGAISASSALRYRRERDITDYSALLPYPLTPSISIIAPAYNEEVTIVDNIRSLLSLHYGNLTVIVVNDGSKDKTLQTAIDEYDLVQIPFEYQPELSTKPVRGIYHSKNRAFKKLIFVDKVNGGKADAINVGINIASTEYFACIDVDCIIEPDAFLKLVKPIMDSSEERIVAVGGIVWLTNDSHIEGGKLIELKAPNSNIARFQVIEYFRAFLLGRTAWASINGLLLISGAFGLFDREIVLKAGGYDHNTVGEDMDLVMRMHRYMREQKMKYRVAYVPEPLCWTEAPNSYKILSRQRNRWTRGTIECLKIHKSMFFNRKYGILGLVSYPYWFFAEWFAPILEGAGLIFFVLMAVLGFINWQFFFLLLLFVYSFAIFISTFAVAFQEISYQSYAKPRDLLKLFGTVLIEAFIYHPRTVWWALNGNFDLFTGKNKGWGDMTRTGFATPKPAA